jgi:hypothetical protein
MTATVTLRWDDPEDAREFLRLREEYRRQGWLTDPAAGALTDIVGESEVVAGGGEGDRDG